MAKTRPSALEFTIRNAAGDDAVVWLRDLCLSGVSYAKCLELLRETYGISSSLAGMSGFYSRQVEPFLLEQRRASAQLARAVLTDGVDNDSWESASVALVRQTAFEVLSNPASDPAARADMVAALLQLRRQDLERRKMEERLKTKVEAGLDALQAELGTNANALAKFEELKALLNEA